MKVLHVISSGGMYGAEAVILNLSHALKSGHHVSTIGVFVNATNPNYQLYEAAAREGIPSDLIPSAGQFDRSIPGAILDLAIERGVDVVHAHGYKADIYTYLSLRRSDIPFVSTCHTWYDNDFTVNLYGIVDRLVLRSFSGVVAVSDDVKRRLLRAGVRSEKIHLIHNGIDIRPFENLGKVDASAPFTVGLVGRLAPEKGVDIFLRAAKRVLLRQPCTRFVVIGEGPEREKLQSLITELGIAANVSLLGHRDDMPSVYASLDIQVSASRHEGLPIALLEGMASSRPIIATPVGQVPSIIKDGITGMIIPPDDPNALAAAILDLIGEPMKREILGNHAHSFVKDGFSAARMAADYLRVYEAVTASVKKQVTV